MKTKLDNIRESETYKAWYASLTDDNAIARIDTRIERLSEGNPGNSKFLGGGVYELKINYGAGYRIYYAKENNVIYLLLCGGTKTAQQADIDKAKKLLKEKRAV